MRPAFSASIRLLPRLRLQPARAAALAPSAAMSSSPPAAAAAAAPPAHARIYTRTGDGGTSGLFRGARAPKDAPVFDALGALDETSAAIGVARVRGVRGRRECAAFALAARARPV